MKIDKYPFECSIPIVSWKIEANNNQKSKVWTCIDVRTRKIKKELNMKLMFQIMINHLNFSV